MRMGFGKYAGGLALATACLVCGCGGGESGDSSGTQGGDGGSSGGNAACASITGGDSRVNFNVDTGCTQCGVTDSQAAADGDLNTAATLKVQNAAPAQGVSIRATAQSGVVFAAGQMAGAYVAVPAGTAQTYTVTIRTLLGGTVQESDSSDNNGGGCGMCGGHPSRFDGFRTTMQFDAVEVFISDSQAGGTPDFKVYEICSDR
jgi:hypothetical protein